jgi:aspartate aminotransferase
MDDRTSQSNSLFVEWRFPLQPSGQSLAAFTTTSDFLESSRAEYRERRDLLLAGLNEIGLPCISPAGAFYAFPDITRISNDSRKASEVLLNSAQ